MMFAFDFLHPWRAARRARLLEYGAGVARADAASYERLVSQQAQPDESELNCDDLLRFLLVGIAPVAISYQGPSPKDKRGGRALLMDLYGFSCALTRESLDGANFPRALTNEAAVQWYGEALDAAAEELRDGPTVVRVELPESIELEAGVGVSLDLLYAERVLGRTDPATLDFLRAERVGSANVVEHRTGGFDRLIAMASSALKSAMSEPANVQWLQAEFALRCKRMRAMVSATGVGRRSQVAPLGAP